MNRRLALALMQGLALFGLAAGVLVPAAAASPPEHIVHFRPATPAEIIQHDLAEIQARQQAGTL